MAEASNEDYGDTIFGKILRREIVLVLRWKICGMRQNLGGLFWLGPTLPDLARYRQENFVISQARNLL